MFAVVRIRGSIKVRKEVNDTLDMLSLKRVNHCVVVPGTHGYLGMLKKARNRITWGKIDKKILAKLFEKRGELTGNREFDKKTLKEITGFADFSDFSNALIEGKIKLKDFKQIKLIFRLNPPRHGFKSTRLPYPRGDLGDRKEKINELLERMI